MLGVAVKPVCTQQAAQAIQGIGEGAPPALRGKMGPEEVGQPLARMQLARIEAEIGQQALGLPGGDGDVAALRHNPQGAEEQDAVRRSAHHRDARSSQRRTGRPGWRMK